MGSHLLSDLYQLKMIYAHWKNGTHLTPATFDLFFRTAPHGASGAVVAGVFDSVQWALELQFTSDEVDFLRSADAETRSFEPAFWDEVIRPFRFTGDIDAMPDGTRAFPGEPIMRVTAPICQAQYVESRLLEKVNAMTLVASKADRLVHAAGGDPVIEMGLRRGHGDDAAVDGARAAYQAGVAATSNIEAGRRYGVPLAGTNAHAWFQFYGNDLDAMLAWARAYQELVFVLDTYDTLGSGLPNAIRAARESGRRLKAVRIDSGDLAYLAKQVRATLDAEGFGDTRIVATSDLDEQIIQNLKLQGAPIDSWGVGTQLITGGKQSALGGVYKLSAVGQALQAAGDPMEAVRWEPRIKLSENPSKVTVPGRKQVVRFLQDGQMAGDAIILAGEPLPDGSEPYTLTDPVHRWNCRILKGYTAVPLLEPMVRGGRRTAPEPADVRAAMAGARVRWQEQTRALRPEHLRLLNPDAYPVALSDPLLALQQELIRAMRGDRPFTTAAASPDSPKPGSA